MNMIKLLLLPVLPVVLMATVAYAQQGLLSVSVEDRHLTSQVDYSDSVQEIANEAENLKVVFQQSGDIFLLEIYIKNAEGEWELLRALEMPAVEGDELSKGTAIPALDGIVTLQTIE